MDEKNKCFWMTGEVQNKRYVVEINVVRLYLNIVLTPQAVQASKIIFNIKYSNL